MYEICWMLTVTVTVTVLVLWTSTCLAKNQEHELSVVEA